MEIGKLVNKQLSVFKRVEEMLVVAQQAQTDETKIEEFQLRFESLGDLINLFESLQLDIVAESQQDQLDKYHKVQTDFDNLQYSIKSIYRTLCPELPECNLNGSRSPSHHSSNHSRNSGIQGSSRSNVKLPRIDIPKFDGNIKNWPTFFDVFNTLIHKNTDLSNIERFQYLISSLTKDASSVVKNLPLTSDNYQIAYDALVNRFQNERQLLTTYWQELFNAPKASGDSAASLRNLLSVFSENLAALSQHKTDMWDFTKVNVLLQKIDLQTKKRFELEFSGKSIPTYAKLYSFLEKQCKALEATTMTNSNSFNAHQNSSSTTKRSQVKSTFLTKTASSQMCAYCERGHSLIVCDAFLKLEPSARHAFIKQERRCYNCLSSTHTSEKCKSKWNCRVCQQRHHTLLHLASNAKPVVDCPSEGADTDKSAHQVNVMTNTLSSRTSTVLFSTAVISILDAQNQYQNCRALLDSASQASFISEDCAKRLGIPYSSCAIPIQGINQMITNSNLGVITSTIKPSQKSSPRHQVEFIVIPRICDKIPSVPVHTQKWRHLQKLDLADPQFGNPGAIDVLLGADVYSLILRNGLRRGCHGEPNAINTVFGWVMLGKIEKPSRPAVNTFYTSLEAPLDATLKRFWELEQVPQVSAESPEDILCERIFVSTHSRDVNGKFIVYLPFHNDSAPTLGDSYTTAVRRFLALERRLQKDSDLRVQYSSFIRDYIEQGHMSMATSKSSPDSSKYYLPHHCVLKPSSTTTKLRVVFDGSAKSSNNVSLNDALLIGPKLQNDIASILLGFRSHQFVFTADIRQMYRQIWVAKEHREYQTILWRFSSDEPIQEYTLNTVTYGVSSSPYLAIRCLIELAQVVKEKYPLASKAILTSMYVDDVVCGAASLEEALELQSQLIVVLAQAGFILRKWTSNHINLLSSVTAADPQPFVFNSDQPDSLKILGLQWSPKSDAFQYEVKPIDRPCTKRNILSELARIYDPLGFLAPLTLFAKHFIQTLWSAGIGWDDTPPPEIQQRWSTYKAQLPVLSSISIPRAVIAPNVVSLQLHGFSDAAEKGYGAVIYLRLVDIDGRIQVSLVSAKSKVSPLKRISIPRLELCAAVLLSDLFEFVLSLYKDTLSIKDIYAWTDSTVALTWIQSSPHKYKTFVANRISHIQDKIPPAAWHHVGGSENPADCSSRGLLPEELVAHPLWWTGPSFLYSHKDNWGLSNSRPMCQVADEEEEIRKVVFTTQIDSGSWITDLFQQFSSLRKIKGIVAYVLRYKRNSRVDSASRSKGALSNAELHEALLTIVRVIQSDRFKEEISILKSGKSCPKLLRRLSPFLAADGLLRVGGRLRHSDLAFEAKHPALLPGSHVISELLISEIHRNNLHPGVNTTLYLLEQNFWIIGARRLIRRCLSRCYRCFRNKPSPMVCPMGDLPKVRVSEAKPFSHVGVDFGGPFTIVSRHTRGAKTSKAYLCLFICLAVKAVHLEIVSDLTTDAFLAALRRFIARRGRCSDIYSDQGTNFVGANRQLQACLEEASEGEGITWHFNPPSAPHFGGIWESGIKSVKSHLARVIGLQILTFEELTTLTTQVEALLNSRPLCSISADPNDLRSLTPGHFLTLEPLTAPPNPDLTHLSHSRLSRWQLVQQMQQSFWARWHAEYLHQLYQRSKWFKSHALNSIDIGSLVLIKSEQTPPLTWKLGRIVQLHPGADGICRVATLRTTQGLLCRPCVKLCPLPPQ